MQSKLQAKPFFSVIMPVYNTAEILLRRSIESVLRQSFADWELIVIVDGMCPDLARIPEIRHQNINLLSIKKSGVSAARNEGIRVARGAYVCFLDSDDEYNSRHLQAIYNTINKVDDKKGVFRTGAVHHHRNQKIYAPQYDENRFANAVDFILSTTYYPSTLCIEKTILNCYKFPEEYRFFEDTHLLVRILLKFPLYQITQYTTNVYSHDAQTTAMMFTSADYKENLQNNIDCINNLFEHHDVSLRLLFSINFHSQLLSDKYLQHANGLLLAGRRNLSFHCLIKSVRYNKVVRNLTFYLKYLLKFLFPPFLNLAKKRLR